MTVRQVCYHHLEHCEPLSEIIERANVGVPSVPSAGLQGQALARQLHEGTNVLFFRSNRFYPKIGQIPWLFLRFEQIWDFALIAPIFGRQGRLDRTARRREHEERTSFFVQKKELSSAWQKLHTNDLAM